MATHRTAKATRSKPDAKADAKTKPVRVDLEPTVHKALRLKAAGEDLSMAALARRIISQHLGFN